MLFLLFILYVILMFGYTYFICDLLWGSNIVLCNIIYLMVH